jgi:hypothetical protein
MSLSDWTSMKPSDWMDLMVAEWNNNYNTLQNLSPSDWWTRMYGSNPAASQGMMGQPQGERQRHKWERREHDHEHERHHHHKHHHHGCNKCGSDSCECSCCIGDVDLVVYTRVGEQRVIPIVVENERHRDKQISVELSGWTTRGGSPAPVETVLIEPKTFTLAACGEQEITLVVRVRQPNNQPVPGQDGPLNNDIGRDGQQVPLDVDDCVVAVADLRLVGCDNRPIRVAVAVLPRDCDPYKVDCGCTCC